MFPTGNLQYNMSSSAFFSSQNQQNQQNHPNSFLNQFSNQFLHLTNNISNSSSSSLNSIGSRCSTPDSINSQRSNTSNNSQISLSNSSINNTDYMSLLAENERLKLELSQLKNINNNANIMEICNNAIKKVDYYMKECNKMKKLYENMKKKKEDESNKLKDERIKKRKFAKILFEFGLSNPSIRQTMGDFQYSAEIRKYNVPQVTKLRLDTEVYNIRDRVGYKEVEFTNSSDLNLDINKLKVIDTKNKNLKIKYTIKKLSSSFGCIYEDNDNTDNNINCHKSHNSKQTCYKPRNSSSKKNYGRQNMDNTNIIRPDEHFLICFEHPIKREVGIHSLSYRLFSQQKADTPRYKGNGAFGQKIIFDYKVENY